MRNLENELYRDMIELYKMAEAETKYKRIRLLQMLNSGVKPSELVKRIIFAEGGNFEFEVLRNKHRLDLSVEAIVVKKRYAKLFCKCEKEWCKSKLQKFGYNLNINN